MSRNLIVALVGNPNTGKTTLFNALAGMNQRVGNYPGVTVETKKGKLQLANQTVDLVDLPGTYSLAPRSPDEMVAVEVLLGQREEHEPDLVVTIVDASNLERNLYLTTQVLEMGIPVLIALNMVDVAKGQGIEIDVQQLSRNLGVPVVPLQANKGRGIDELKTAIEKALTEHHVESGPIFPEAFQKEVDALGVLVAGVSPFLRRRLLLDVGGYTETLLTSRFGPELNGKIREARERLGQAGCAVPAIEARVRYGWIRDKARDCVKRPAQRVITTTDKIDRVLTHKVWGAVIFLAMMFLVFESIFIGAGPFMDWIGTGVDELAGLIQGAMSPGPLRDLLSNGIVKGVGGVLVFIPQILILFAFIAVLEDCGYMARAAFLMDRLMSRAGLNGKSFIPLLSSVACAIPGIMAARVIENRRDRFATMIVAPLMSCSARLPVYSLLAYTFLGPKQGYSTWLPGLVIFAMYLVGLIVAPLVALCLKKTLLRGETPAFVMEMPLYKIPSIRLVIRRALEACWMFIRRAGTIILASMIIVWALLYFPHTDGTGASYDDRLQALSDQKEEEKDEEKAAKIEEQMVHLKSEWQRQSYLGRAGKALEPIFEPLGWDWRIGMAALASFPAREVIVGTLGIIYDVGEGDAGEEDYRDNVGAALTEATWDQDPGRKVFTIPVALGLMVFFALCCQCASTLAVIKRETNSWLWPIFTFVYMTVLAYMGALLVFQIGSLL